MLEAVARRFRDAAPAADGWTLRALTERSHGLVVRNDVLEPVRTHHDQGAMITVVVGSGVGYAATSDLTTSGLRAAGARARAWAESGDGRMVAAPSPAPTARGAYRLPTPAGWSSRSLGDIVAQLQDACRRLLKGSSIADRLASLEQRDSAMLLVSSAGAEVRQDFSYIQPYLAVTANRGGESQTRSFGGDGARQGGFEQLVSLGFEAAANRLADEALALLGAPNCPSGAMDVVLMPSQMVLQIHESIGHPLELDRILGDERNYAGTSFVTPGMFGTYRYGSPLLNVTFDPTPPEELASYAFDDEGTPARRDYLIRDGILLRGLGGLASQSRSQLPGTANARASSWNRPPIDRMANLNLEPGDATLEELIGGIDSGILMDTNRSWSIDDARNKFQFGCEYARLISDGRLAGVVKNPNYRGISSSFWRTLTGVGRVVQVSGTPNCGKGEPNQIIHVGHATPACRFTAVDVFGGG